VVVVLLVLWPFVFVGLVSVFFSVVSPLRACEGQLLFGQHQVMSVTCFPLNEIRAKARLRKRSTQ